MEDLDVKLISFFHSVIADEIKHHTRDTHRECLLKLKTLKNEEFSSAAFRCAYLYYHGPCLTSSLVHHFRQLFKSYSPLLQTIQFRGTFTVCCITKGLVTDFVSLIIVLLEKYRNYPIANSLVKKLEIEAVIVNMDSSCEDMLRKMVENLSQIVDTSKIIFGIRFLSIDFTKSLTDDVKQTLLQSDFITMTHFLSSVHEDMNSLQVIQVNT